MKIATFNVNSIRARLPIVTAWLKERQPDVLCVQETKVQDSDFPSLPLQELGYHVEFRGQKSYNGVAILSKTRPQEVHFGLDDEPKDEPRLIRVRINDIVILNTYVPQGQSPDSDKFQYKLAWFGRLRTYLDSHLSPGEPVVWVGDLNVAPEPIDVYNPKALLGHVCFCPEVTEAFLGVKDWGLVDVFRQHHQEPDLYTFWDYRARGTFERNRGWRVDHILTTRSMAERCTTCEIDKGPRSREKPSDHTPVMATFQV